jgi:RNA-directed DNA polymerase
VLEAGAWRPRPTTCFIATRPKAREIHAPDFSDRVVHHWLVPQLERVYEPGFIHDSYANRRGKGSHAAVRRLQAFVRQVHSGQGGGWYLQLDVHNFFNLIHRPTLWAMLKRRLARAGLPEACLRVTHALLQNAPTRQGVVYRASAEERAAVPAHKRLENAPPGCGLPIGNLSSQFFANVYLDRLDQFVKHTLKAPRYLRYVDDFVLVHHDRAQLEAWQQAIAAFLARELRLSLKPDIRLRPLPVGIDFLGYVVYPTHSRIRRRVVSHARDALSTWARKHVRGTEARVQPQDVRDLQATWASYQGHFRHGASGALTRDFDRRYPWLQSLVEPKRRFDRALEGSSLRFRVRA